MEYLLIPLIIVLMIMVVVSLVRGIIAFMHSTKLDLERDEGTGATEMQIRQNKMMFSRIKFQALAVLAVALMLMLSQ